MGEAARSARTLFHEGRYKGIANTIVQLIHRSISGVIGASRPIRSDLRHCRKQACPNRSPVRKNTTSIIDKALEANRNYAKNYNPTLGKHPAPKIVVVTCMDPRLSDLPGILGRRKPISTLSEPADLR